MCSTIKDIMPTGTILLVMKIVPLIIVLLIIFSFIIPAVSAEKEGQYSYINIKSVNLELSENKAVYDLNYTIDNGIQYLVLFLGKSDLKTKLCKAMDIESCKFEVVDMNHAIMITDNPSLDNGDGSLWFPRKDMLTNIPEISIKTPRTIKNYKDTKEIPGIGYFAEPLNE